MMEQPTPTAEAEPRAKGAERAQASMDSTPSLTDSADQAVQSAATLYHAADAALQQRMQDNPYATLAAAAAVGFVLGGGLQSRTGQFLMSLSVRAFGRPLLHAAVQSVLTHAGVEPDEPEAPPSSKSHGPTRRASGSTRSAHGSY
jgi:ElaB/YqjD/DUF883 family membrane-anchored ribosome-binding protein